MTVLGEVATVTATVAGGTGSTTMVLTVTSPLGVVTTPTATTSNAGATWSASVTYSKAGEWDLRWVSATPTTVTNQRVLVAPSPITTGRAYATTEDLANWLDTAPPADSRRMLRAATVLIDKLIKTAVYDVDSNDLPTDTDIAAALRDATCELVNWWQQTGDEHGVSGALQSATIGSVSINQGSSLLTDHRVGPQVLIILGNAGLLGLSPIVI